MITTASIIGTGNVASHLALSLKEVGVSIEYVVGRDFQRAKMLADRVGAIVETDMQNINSQLIIISVSDDAYSDVISNLDYTSDTIFVHTSGSIPMSIFASKFTNYGVFYPLQTFTLNRKVEMTHIPFCLEASSNHVYDQLSHLASKLSTDIRSINSVERQQIHIAAIFCNNFVNFLYGSASELLTDHRLSFDILHSLILETAQKAIELDPENAQTGPAKRGDISIVDKHVAMIENPKLKELYVLLSNQIKNKYNS